MATLKSDIAPAAKLATETPGIGSALAARLDQLDAMSAKDKASVRDKCDKAFRAGTSAGYFEAVDASAAIGMDWAALADWVQSDGRKPTPSEQAIRNLHDRNESATCPKSQQADKDLLRRIANASDPAIIKTVKEKYSLQPGADEGADRAAALASLVRDRDNAGDPALRATLDNAIAAIDNIDALTVLNKALNAKAKAATNFRRRLFAHLLDPLTGVPADKLGFEYRLVYGVALATHKKFSALSGQDKSADPATRLRANVTSAVAEYINGKFGKKVAEERSEEDLAALACNALANAVKRCLTLDLITNVEGKNIVSKARQAMAKLGVTWETPDETQTREKAERKATAEEAKQQALIDSGKAAAPTTTRGKKTAAPAKGATKTTKVRASAPASDQAKPVVASVQDDLEDVLAEMKSA
jgi:hypothetical protein